MSARSISHARGYTLIEVMMSLSILGLGAMGIVALQKTTSFGNADARNLSTASNLATSWAERLRADGVAWRNLPSGDSLDSTVWLQNATDTPGASTAWFPPAVVADVASPAADLLGADVFVDDPEPIAFCTQIRLTRLYDTLIRAEIRVYWDRDFDPLDCGEDPDDVTGRFGEYGFVYVSAGIPKSMVQE